MVWLDALDLPLFYYLEGSYATEGPLQAQRNRPDASQVEYLSAGLAPTRRLGRGPRRYPMMRYPWGRTEAALREMARFTDGPIELDFVNPETGDDVLPTMGFTAMMIAGGATDEPPLRSSSAAYHVVKGLGRAQIDGESFAFGPKDTFSAPVFARITFEAEEECFLVRVHDRPLQEKLGYYEERAR